MFAALLQLIRLSQFAPNEIPSEQEKKTSLAILSKLDSGTAKVGKKPKGDHASGAEDDGAVLNVRKALRHASGGRGGAALGRELSRNNSSRGRAGPRGGRRGSSSRGKGRGK
jgi:regulator of ribosome biosynthesis